MIELIIILVAFFVWCLPGLGVARNLYGRKMKEVGRKGSVVIPPQPKRPEIKLAEMLHYRYPKECGLLQKPSKIACSCDNRQDWIKLRNQWEDYDEWQRTYGHIKNGVTRVQQPSISKHLMMVPFWPVVLSADYIRSGANNLPDYTEINRLENELKELDSD